MNSLTLAASIVLGLATSLAAQPSIVTNATAGSSQVLEARFSPDGRQIITTGTSNSVRLWDLRTGKPIAEQAAHLGTWQLVSYKYGDQGTWTAPPAGQRRLKFVTPTHFIWTAYDTSSGNVETTAGGTYTLNGSSYTEFIEFAGEGMTDYLHKKQPFTLKVEGNKWTQSGQLSDGTKIEEIWERAQGSGQ